MNKNLIIYFSHNGENYMEDGIRNIEKGNTEILSEILNSLIDADTFKIETIKNYPINYNKCCDIAKDELNNNIKPELKNYLNNIDDYKTIYILTPIWWGTTNYGSRINAMA